MLVDALAVGKDNTAPLNSANTRHRPRINLTEPSYRLITPRSGQLVGAEGLEHHVQ